MKNGVTCVVLCVACTVPSIYLVCVVLGTAIPTSLYIFGKCFSYFIQHSTPELELTWCNVTIVVFPLVHICPQYPLLQSLL